MRNPVFAIGLGLIVPVLTAPPTSAQDANLFARDRNIAVDQRGRPELEALGVRAGSFMAYPKLQIDIGRDSNVAVQGNDELRDNLLRVSPRLDVESDWTRHYLGGNLRGAFTQYETYESENTDSYGIQAAGRLDVRRFTQINAGVEAARDTESRTSSGAPNAFESPASFVTQSAYVGATHTVNRVRGSAQLNVRDYSFDDVRTFSGVTLDQDDRNLTTYDLSTRIDYALSPATALFGRLVLNERQYETGGTATTPSRDSQGLNGLVGVNAEISNLLRGEVGVGYLKQEFDNPLYGEISGFSTSATLEYFVTPLLTLGLSGDRSVSDSGIAGTAGFLTTSIEATADYELRRNVLIAARLGRTIDAFDDIDRENKRWIGSLRATYLVNRRVGLTATYDYQTRDSSGAFATNDFTTQRVLLSLVLQY